MKERFYQAFIFFLLLTSGVSAQQIIPGAERNELYEGSLKNKRIGLVVNHTSMVFDGHLVDYLISRELNVTKIFSPEHGFRGVEDAGKHIEDTRDEKTGVPIVSLYGSNRKPTTEQMQDLDIVVFDIQDVGARFYTYISTMHYMMEACAENGIEMIILDRPNPNGDYVDGPVLREGQQSFVGMHPIPVVHGLTVGELAKMINGEKWLSGGKSCRLNVVTVENYEHQYLYSLPVRPSPNLPNDLSIRLYPSLCFFEGTMMSVGRGTDFPFQVVGYPDKSFGKFDFTPENVPGATDPKYKDQKCYGKDFRELQRVPGFTISYVIEFYNKSGRDENFFTSYFNTLAGNDELMEQIKAGLTEEEIRISWLEELNHYKALRKKYLLYPDFE
ncbi:MAG: DUF1343 domain-containing protein [Cyclobacteriaceae bacterium]|nr:DUF1343 domain-containing protein [Cyclobacteriaceae bacterium]